MEHDERSDYRSHVFFRYWHKREQKLFQEVRQEYDTGVWDIEALKEFRHKRRALANQIRGALGPAVLQSVGLNS